MLGIDEPANTINSTLLGFVTVRYTFKALYSMQRINTSKSQSNQKPTIDNEIFVDTPDTYKQDRIAPHLLQYYLPIANALGNNYMVSTI